MSLPKWTAEHGNLLKSLREKAGLDIATLARKNMVSPLQVGQLEDGGESAFYNADIKFAAGKKLLQALGHRLPEQTQTPSEAPIKAPNEVKPAQGLPRNSFSITPQKTFWLLLFLLIALGLLGLYVDKSQKKADASPANLPTLTVTTTAAVSSEKTTESPEALVTPANATDPVAAPLPPTPTAPATTLPTQKQNSTCNWNVSAVEIQPTSPRKSAEYVHMQALNNGVICIRDGEQRVATLELQAGDERSIYGTAPFSVYSANLSQIKLYFQGQLIKLPSEETQHLKLTAASTSAAAKSFTSP
jgi:transcriptional regulator with XRE-family HTH domain